MTPEQTARNEEIANKYCKVINDRAGGDDDLLTEKTLTELLQSALTEATEPLYKRIEELEKEVKIWKDSRLDFLKKWEQERCEVAGLQQQLTQLTADCAVKDEALNLAANLLLNFKALSKDGRAWQIIEHALTTHPGEKLLKRLERYERALK